MIKFFRHIRQSMINQNRTKKYLLYAIGEIILVVIGILIALQINNWNENRKERILESNILDKITANIEDDINQYNKILSAEKTARVKVDSFLTIIRNPMRFQTSDLDPYYKSLWYFQRFTPNKSAMTNLISSGKINIIINQELLENVLGYYKIIDEQTASVDEALASYTRNEIGPYIMKFDFMDSKAINSEHRKRKSLLEYHMEPAIENLAYARIQLMNTQKAYYNRQINYAKQLLAEINKELKDE